MEQYRSIIANSVKPEEVGAPLVPPPDVHWPRSDDGVGDDSDGEEPGALPSGLAAVERSVDAVYARYTSQKPDGKVTKEGIRQIFDRLDKEHTAKAERQRIRDCRGKTTNDVSEVYSPPRVIEVAEATGLRPGWALDLTVNRDDGTP